LDRAKPAVSEAAAPTLPDRWFLMKALQGTWPGFLLDTERFSISGWTEASFTASSVRDNQLPMGFNYLANQFALQQNWVRFERFVVTNGTGNPAHSTMFYAMYLYREAFTYFKMGIASAMAWILFIIVFALTLVSFRVSRAVVHYE